MGFPGKREDLAVLLAKESPKKMISVEYTMKERNATISREVDVIPDERNSFQQKSKLNMKKISTGVPSISSPRVDSGEVRPIETYKTKSKVTKILTDDIPDTMNNTISKDILRPNRTKLFGSIEIGQTKYPESSNNCRAKLLQKQPLYFNNM